MAKHLYLHVPFCQNICYYCDFCHRLYDENTVNKWLKEVKEEISNYEIEKDLKTIYIGGGTPSSLKYNELEELLKLLKPYSEKTQEYTIEANPESIDIDKIKLLKKYGINRISMGVEAIQDKLLKMMNRRHNFEDVKRTVSLLNSEGIDNISLDLMYSLPYQSLEDFNESLVEIAKLNIKHISIYSLTIEENTVFAKKGYSSLDDEMEADMYEMAVDYLNSMGFKQYEISNFAKDGFYSKHNLSYWDYEDFYGISLGASGKLNDYRYDNTRSFTKYFSKEYIENIIYLDKKDKMFEETMMSLRLVKGLDLKRFKKRYDIDFFEVYKKPFEYHVDDFIIENDFLRVKNLALLNSILVDFL